MWWQNEKVMNKLLYKIELYLVKVIPMIYVLLSLLNTTLSYFNINVILLSYIGSVSFIILLFLYVTSNVSRATFDNYVREGKLPRGKHEIGFKELSWSEKELDEFVKKCRNNTLLRSKKYSLA